MNHVVLLGYNLAAFLSDIGSKLNIISKDHSRSSNVQNLTLVE